jgi:hypothetical protein
MPYLRPYLMKHDLTLYYFVRTEAGGALILETWQPTGTSSALSYTKLAPPDPQLAKTLDPLGDVFEDDGESVPPPVGSGEGLPEGAGEGLSVGEEPEEGDELGALEGDSGGVTEGSAVGAEEGLELGATSAGEGAEEGSVPGAEGISLGPAGGVVGGVAVGASTVGDPPGGVAGIISFSAALLIRPYPATEAPITRNGRKNFEIFIIYTLSFFVLSCETAYMTLLDATYRILVKH